MKFNGKIFFHLSLVLAFSSLPVLAQETLINRPDSPYQIILGAETGFLAVPAHTIQFGTKGSRFDYVTEGNQDVLFPFLRYTAEVIVKQKHGFTFLVQPLDIRTRALLTRDVTIDQAVFSNNTLINLRYGFTFYRGSYTYYFKNDAKGLLGAGLDFQIRNAAIEFESGDGKTYRNNDNIGPVPIIKLIGRRNFESGFWIGTELDGFYASSSFFNGADFKFVGAIWDLSLRCGLRTVYGSDLFLNVRYLGGGAYGTSQNNEPPSDGFTDNWLNTFSVSLGAYIR
jgi:hypothetical protein